MEPNEYIKWCGPDIFSNFSWSLLRISQCGFKSSRNSCGMLLRIYSSLLFRMKSSVLSKLSSMEPVSTWYSWSSSKYLATPGQKYPLLSVDWSRKPITQTPLCPSENTQSPSFLCLQTSSCSSSLSHSLQRSPVPPSHSPHGWLLSDPLSASGAGLSTHHNKVLEVICSNMESQNLYTQYRESAQIGCLSERFLSVLISNCRLEEGMVGC